MESCHVNKALVDGLPVCKHFFVMLHDQFVLELACGGNSTMVGDSNISVRATSNVGGELVISDSLAITASVAFESDETRIDAVNGEVDGPKLIIVGTVLEVLEGGVTCILIKPEFHMQDRSIVS